MGKGTAWLRDRRVWWTVGTILVLTAVILGVAAVSAPKQSEPEVIRPNPSIEAESLAKQAETALSNGETATALALAQEALDVDPKNSTAKTVVEQAESTPAPVSNNQSTSDSSETASTDQSDGVYAKAVSKTSLLVPNSIKGWTRGTLVTQKAETLVTFEPKSGSSSQRTTVRALVIAHDRGTKAKAEAFVAKVDKRVYTKDKATVDVGAVDAYFASDGSKLAVVAFTRGRYAFEVILTAQPKVKPGTLKSVGIIVAGALPAAK